MNNILAIIVYLVLCMISGSVFGLGFAVLSDHGYSNGLWGGSSRSGRGLSWWRRRVCALGYSFAPCLDKRLTLVIIEVMHVVVVATPLLKPIPPVSYTPPYYTLLSIMQSADVKHSSGYAGLHACEEAKSFEMTGKSIEAYAQMLADQKAQYLEIQKQWLIHHPPRPPRTEQEKRAVQHPDHAEYACFPDACFHVTPDHLIQDESPFIYITNGLTVSEDNRDADRTVREALCVPSGGDVP